MAENENESTKTLRIGARSFEVAIVRDYHSGAPWENSDYMPVSDWACRAKAPGELIVNTDDHGCKRFFDFSGCVREYRKGGTKGADAAMYARGNYERCRAWCANQWHYVGVVVTDVGEDINTSLWGVESDSPEYHDTVAIELAQELIGGQTELPGLECDPVWGE